MIRPATFEDLMNIVIVHEKCFPDSFSTTMGRSLLSRFYNEYLAVVPELFLVYENEQSEIVGFCMGYYCDNNKYMKFFLQKNILKIFFRILLLLLTGSKPAWKKLLSIFIKKIEFEITNLSFEKFSLSERGDLLSICVLPKYRGSGIAQKLLSDYLIILKNAERKMCLLTVDVTNRRGIRFYEKNGFTVYKKYQDKVYTYAKLL